MYICVCIYVETCIHSLYLSLLETSLPVLLLSVGLHTEINMFMHSIAMHMDLHKQVCTEMTTVK